MPFRPPHHTRLAPRVHSEDQRARVEGPSEGRVLKHPQRVWMSSAYAYDAHADDVPLLGVLRTSVVIGAPACRGGYLMPAFEPTKTLFPETPREGSHLSEDRDVFHRHDIRRSIFDFARRGLTRSVAFVPTLPPAPLALSPLAEECRAIFDEHCECHGAVTRSIRDCSRVQTPF
jgi:hypothetical protein